MILLFDQRFRGKMLLTFMLLLSHTILSMSDVKGSTGTSVVFQTSTTNHSTTGPHVNRLPNRLTFDRPHPNCTFNCPQDTPDCKTRLKCLASRGQRFVLPDTFDVSSIHPRTQYVEIVVGGVVLENFIPFPLERGNSSTLVTQFTFQEFNIGPTDIRFPLSGLLVNVKKFILTLMFYSVKLVSFTANDLRGFNNLNWFTCDACQLTSIDVTLFEAIGEGAVNWAPFLRMVEITNNPLQSVDWTFLKPISNRLEHVQLFDNGLNEDTLTVSGDFVSPTLFYVTLGGNRFRRPPAQGVFRSLNVNLVNLQIYLEGNRFCANMTGYTCCEMAEFGEWVIKNNVTRVFFNNRHQAFNAIPWDITADKDSHLAYQHCHVAPFWNDMKTLILVTCLLLGAFGAVLLLVWNRRRRLLEDILRKIDRDVAEYRNNLWCGLGDSNSKLIGLLKQYFLLLDVPRSTLELSETILGKGEYGIVYKGLAHSLPGVAKGPTVVAVKTLTNVSIKERQAVFLAELKIMAKLGRHVNVINLLGTVATDQLYMILEFCAFGSLLSFLKQIQPDSLHNQVDEDGNSILLSWEPIIDEKKEPNRLVFQQINGYLATKEEEPLGTADFLSFSYQISRGMEYLGTRSIIHRDLASRNILVADNRILKISDFGLAKHKEALYLASDAMVALPILWMPPDAIIDRVFSAKTDVWSFGVVLWEIFSLGAAPFDGSEVEKSSAGAFAHWLLDGNQMGRPSLASMQIYEIMQKCWALDKEQRLSFTALRSELDVMLMRRFGDDTYVTLPVVEKPFLELQNEILRCLDNAEMDSNHDDQDLLADVSSAINNHIM